MTEERALSLGEDAFRVRIDSVEGGVCIAAYDGHGSRATALYTVTGMESLPPGAEPIESMIDFIEGELRQLQLLRLTTDAGEGAEDNE